MAIEISPTLELMSRIYGLSSAGGAASERFRAYREAAEARTPIYGYNPMTREPVQQTIAGLLSFDAEAVAKESANKVANRIGFDENAAMHLTVATPGMWTDRFGTEIEHRLKANDPGGILLWQGDVLSRLQVDQEAIAQTVRLALHRERGGQAPGTLREAVEQEGAALAQAGADGSYSETAERILLEHLQEPDIGTMVAFLYGDKEAAKLGYSPIGIDDRSGYLHAIARDSSEPGNR